MGPTQGPPYLPPVAGVGGLPTVSVDIPICAVFIAIFATGAACHMTLYRLNLSRGRKFIPSLLTFAFCMIRIVTNSMRIAWAAHPTNVSVAIAAQVFLSAGVLVLWILAMIHAQRILRGANPKLAWSRPLSYFFKALYVIVVLSLLMVVAVTVLTFFTLNPDTRLIARHIQLYGASYFLFFAFLPLPIVAYSAIVAPRNPVERFGKGSWRTKLLIIAIASILLTIVSGFRAGTSYMSARPNTNPAWYHHKAPFYIFNFTFEAIVVFLFFFGRVDQRFYIPDGSSKVRTYNRSPDAQSAEGSSTREDYLEQRKDPIATESASELLPDNEKVFSKTRE
ncbi:hypothetical protein AJ80_04939 [Polytolypa hystricis UAMH7299]|uniref:Uncharacterized protein n=1 Tax=Polytolypa hystricis (strain UAMH7299) TaxID=1447883 RepID=A0A2B7Y6B9_POLH7|nr:hypothetical protein AJ80_04939 [Polytolypa hystricis UAMH7299]